MSIQNIGIEIYNFKTYNILNVHQITKKKLF